MAEIISLDAYRKEVRSRQVAVVDETARALHTGWMFLFALPLGICLYWLTQAGADCDRARRWW